MMLPRISSPLDSGFRRNDVGGVVVHHGNHSPIMAIMVQRVPLWIPACAGMTAERGIFPPSRSVRGLGGCSQFNNCQRIPCVSLRSPRPLTLKRRGRDGKIMAIIRPSWQSWFTPLWIPAFAGMTVKDTGMTCCVGMPRHSLRACHSERSEESPPFAERKGARGMPAIISK